MLWHFRGSRLEKISEYNLFFFSIFKSQVFKYSFKFLKAYEAAINLFEDDLALNWESVLRTEYGDVTKAEAMKRVFMQP